MSGQNGAVEFRALVSDGYAKATELLRTLKRFRIADYLRTPPGGKPVVCVYLIWSPDGTLVYVGKTSNLRLRLQNHVSRSGHLVRCVSTERGLNPDARFGHKCVCGELIDCRNGPLTLPRDGRVGALIKEIRDTYLLSFITVDSRDMWFNGTEFEKYVQYALNPVHGWGPQGRNESAKG